MIYLLFSSGKTCRPALPPSDNPVTKAANKGAILRKIGEISIYDIYSLTADIQRLTQYVALLEVMLLFADAECEARRHCKNLQKSKH